VTLPWCLCAFTGGAGGIIIGLATQQLLTNAFMGLSLVRHLNGRLRPSNSRAAVSYLQQGQPVAVCSLQDMSLADANDVLSKLQLWHLSIHLQCISALCPGRLGVAAAPAGHGAVNLASLMLSCPPALCSGCTNKPMQWMELWLAESELCDADGSAVLCLYLYLCSAVLHQAFC
jgi:hypothetical protein